MPKPRRRTERYIMTTLSVFALGPAGATGQDAGVAGVWEGTLVAGPQRLQIIFRLEGQEGGGLGGTMDVPAQGATGIPLTTVTFEGRSLSLAFPVPGGGAYEGVLSDDGNRFTGAFRQAGQDFPMELTRADATATAPRRPQEPAPPFPYLVEDASINNDAAAVTLAGTLTLPRGAGPFPAAVLVSGSGPQDRDESLLGHKPFLVLADHLTRNGIAVLRYDDRGVGASTGDFSAATSEDFADDALAVVTHLADDPRIDPRAIGIIGHSEGGLVGPMAARGSDQVSYLVLLAGPGVPGLEILVEQGRLINAANGTPAEVTEFNARLQQRLASVAAESADPSEAGELMRSTLQDELASLSDQIRVAVEESLTEEAISQTIAQMNSPWFRYFLQYDPRHALEDTSVPVLALFGEKDLQVPPHQSADEVRAALDRGDNPDATVHVLPGLNHLFQAANTGSPTEYAVLEETFNEAALSLVSEWIGARFGAQRAREDTGDR